MADTSAQTPFFSALRAYAASRGAWHTPGHKLGRDGWPAWRDALQCALQLDPSDVLGDPLAGGDWDAALHAAQDRAARLYNVQACRFLTGGSTQGVQVMLLVAGRRGRRFALPRFSHMSAYAGLILADLWPVFIHAQYDAHRQLPGRPQASDWAECDPDQLAGCLITHPNTYGLAASAQPAAALARRGGGLLLADEAWGAHLPFADTGLAPSGAPLRVQSAHKLLTSLTQSAWLLIDEPSLLPDVDWALQLLASSSPSPLLLASLDAAAAHLGACGRDAWEALALRRDKLQRRLADAGIPVWGGLVAPPPGDYDATRVVVEIAELGWDGFAAAHALRTQFGVQVELADARRVLFVITPADDDERLEQLGDALIGLRTIGLPRSPLSLPPPPWAPQRLAPRAAALGPRRAVLLDAAPGSVCAELVCPYPPGVPVLAPGQDVTAEIVEYLQEIRAANVTVRGNADPGLERLMVVA